MGPDCLLGLPDCRGRSCFLRRWRGSLCCDIPIDSPREGAQTGIGTAAPISGMMLPGLSVGYPATGGLSQFHSPSLCEGASFPCSSLLTLTKIPRAEVPEPVAFPRRICSICSEEFELRPDKPGYANRCPACSEEAEAKESGAANPQQQSDRDLNDARKKAMRDLLYRKES